MRNRDSLRAGISMRGCTFVSLMRCGAAIFTVCACAALGDENSSELKLPDVLTIGEFLVPDGFASPGKVKFEQWNRTAAKVDKLALSQILNELEAATKISDWGRTERVLDCLAAVALRKKGVNRESSESIVAATEAVLAAFRPLDQHRWEKEIYVRCVHLQAQSGVPGVEHLIKNIDLSVIANAGVRDPYDSANLAVFTSSFRIIALSSSYEPGAIAYLKRLKASKWYSVEPVKMVADTALDQIEFRRTKTGINMPWLELSDDQMRYLKELE